MNAFNIATLAIGVTACMISATALVMTQKAREKVRESEALLKSHLMRIRATRIADEISEAATSAGLEEGSVIDMSPELVAILVESPDYDAGSVDDDYATFKLWRVAVAEKLGAGATRRIHCRFTVGDKERSLVFDIP